MRTIGYIYYFDQHRGYAGQREFKRSNMGIPDKVKLLAKVREKGATHVKIATTSGERQWFTLERSTR